MVFSLFTTADFHLLHDFYGAEEGKSPFCEAADGTVKRRIVRACRINTQAALEFACRALQPSGEDTFGQALALCELFARDGQALVYVEATHTKRAKPQFGGLRVGTEADVLGAARLLAIPVLRKLPALYQ